MLQIGISMCTWMELEDREEDMEDKVLFVNRKQQTLFNAFEEFDGDPAMLPAASTLTTTQENVEFDGLAST